MDLLKKKLNGLHAGKILDVGTGQGEFLTFLVESFARFDSAVGIDFYEEPLVKAREMFSDGERFVFIKCGAEELPFPDASFDTVCISRALHHLHDAPKALAEMKRVLKPGGLLIVNEMYSDDQTEPQMTHVLYHHFRGEVERLRGINHRDTFKKNEIRQMVGELHLSSVEDFDWVETKADVKEEKELHLVAGTIDDLIDSVRDYPEFNMLQAKGEAIKKRLYSIGILRPTHIIILGIK